ncbi:COG4705 family protein [Sphingomonas astaxanthinifaciens]|uniref:Membrane protein n=1 Tax=Sphingomonas astaxanthinifaciens DSM 22298 TaxID=1123267 RepID=A0ABQ5Z7I3_9SPHN|nr:membrane protein [Sphingomonas astaxanthinifaciens]GLR47502.1 membrane protein [Sphingomonas astaxanthinifaciens DSM 22298]
MASSASSLSKVPALTLAFWVIKICATTLGETAGDTVSMSWLGEATPDAGSAGLNGYLVGTVLFGATLAILVALQIRARRFHPALYWATILASTTAGTTLADFATRSVGLGYAGGSALLFGLVLASLGAWKAVEGRIATDHVSAPRTEAFYWLTITFSQTLGTALGDWAADDGGLGYLGGAALFGGLIALLAILTATTRINRAFLFWSAFILTRPLGATVGDFLDKPLAKGGLDLSRPLASLVLLAIMAVLVWTDSRRNPPRSASTG